MTDTLSAPAPAPAPAVPVQLELTGMTCASCANRIERGLNKVPGVEASVNYATEKATVRSVADGEPVDVDALLAAVQKAGYSASLVVPREASAASPRSADATVPERDELAPLRRRLLISLVLTVPVVALSMIPALQFTYWQWLVLTLAAPVAVWGAWPFHRAAAVNARHGNATMDTLISVGVAAAFLWSLYALFLGGAGTAGMTMTLQLFGTPGSGAHEIYLEVAAAVTVFILAGRYLEARAKRESGAAMNALLDLAARDAIVLRDGVEISVPVEQLQVNDRFIVRPGSTVATDGVVIEGETSLDASLLTGESLPVDVEMDSRVTGGTVNVGGGRLVVEASRVGADTELARLARLVEEAQTGKARVQRLADRVSGVFVPVVILLSLGTLVGWLLLGGTAEQAFTAAVATLIIACPCALGLATPTALLVGTGRGSQLGILIKGPQVLEQTRRIDTIVLDKTGTITSGAMSVVAVLPTASTVSPLDADALLALAAAAEHGSEHPLGRAVVEHAAAQGLALPPVSGFTAHAGAGVSAEVDGHAVAIGRPAWLAEQWAIPVPDAAAADLAAHESHGATPVAVAVDGSFAGLVVLADTVKASAALAVERFRALGLTPMIVTGDNAGAAAAVAAEVGISADAVRASVTPSGKLDVIRALQAEGRVVAMVGDGVNDAAALAAADLGIAMGGGTDAAMAASDLTIVSGDLLVVADGIRLARRTLRTIVGNLFWAFGYNVAAIPVAMLGLLNPLLAGLAMALSSVFVVTNSLRLRGFRALPRP